MKWILLRHPHTLANEERIFPSEGDIPYSLRGMKERERIFAQTFLVDRIISSPYARCLQLAQELSRDQGIPLDIRDELKEIDVGVFAGLRFEEISARWPEETAQWMEQKEAFCYHGGECFGDIERRIAFLQEAREDLLILSHQAVLLAISRCLGDESPFETGEWRVYELEAVSGFKCNG